MKFALLALVGFCIMVIISIAGCGSVELMPAADGGAGAAGDAIEMAKLDGGGAAGAGGTGGAAGASGAAGADAGTAGAPGRPLGAGCSTDNQCGSGICAKDQPGAVSGMCCDGVPDTCTQCVGGYKTPRPDGNGCGPEMCDGTDRKWSLCKAGVCTAEVVHCATALCDKAGNKICPGGTELAGCMLEDNPCFCYDAAGSGHVSYPCPTT